MSVNTRLSDLLDYMLDVQLTIDQRLPAAERDRPGTAEDWSIKDNLAHNTEWAGHHLADLEAVERSEAWPAPDDEDGDVDHENRLIFETYQNASWADVHAHLRDTYGRGKAYLARVGREALLAPLPHESERLAWRHLAGNFLSHPMIHIWEYLVKHDHGDVLRAVFDDSFFERLLAVSEDDDQWRGTTLYNLACISALSGQTEEAIEKLGRALAMVPGLTEWSRQDSDLDSLRDEPAYQALYA